MRTLVTTECFAQPGCGDDVANLLIEILARTFNTMAVKSSGSYAIRTTRITSPESRSGLSATTTTTT